MESFWYLPPAESPVEPPAAADPAENLRLFPIVGADLCYRVSALLARGRLEDAAELVSDRAWVASTPLYG
jgi:hypothetical protein